MTIYVYTSITYVTKRLAKHTNQEVDTQQNTAISLLI